MSPALSAAEPVRVGAGGFRRVEHVMGTVVSFDVRDSGHDPRELDAAIAFLHDVDARFSTYRDDSEISRLGRGELGPDDCSPDVRFILALSEDLRRTSRGVFDIRRHRADGRLDPSGVVKGWSIEEAGWLVGDAGIVDCSINAGGDVLVRGGVAPGRPWRVGIRHPRIRERMAGVLAVRDAAVATSGAYERGAHIVDPRTGRPPSGLVSVTVVGPSLTYADAYATTAFAMGLEGLAWIAERPGYGAFGITSDDRVLWTPEVDHLLA